MDYTPGGTRFFPEALQKLGRVEGRNVTTQVTSEPRADLLESPGLTAIILLETGEVEEKFRDRI